jgi:hypothetical protein
VSESYDRSRQIETSTVAASLLEALLTITSQSLPNNSKSPPSFIITATTQGSNFGAVYPVRIIRRCLHSLHQPMQYLEDRKALLTEYGTATSYLKDALVTSPYSAALGSSAFLFSIYEV